VSPTTVGLAVVSEYLAAVPRVVRDLRSRGVSRFPVRVLIKH